MLKSLIVSDRNIIKYSLVIITTLFSIIAQASTPMKLHSYGFKGGLTISNAEGYVNSVQENIGAENLYHYTSYYSGFLKFKIFGSERILLRPEFAYVLKGFDYQQTIIIPGMIPGKASYEFTYLEFPLILIYSMNPGGDIRPRIFAGTYAARLLEAWNEFDGFRNHYENDQVNKWEYGIKAGAGMDVSNLIIEFSYSLANTKPLINSDIKNYMYNFTLGYSFLVK